MSWLAEVFPKWWAAPIETVTPEVNEPKDRDDDQSSMAEFVKILRAELERDEGETA